MWGNTLKISVQKLLLILSLNSNNNVFSNVSFQVWYSQEMPVLSDFNPRKYK